MKRTRIVALAGVPLGAALAALAGLRLRRETPNPEPPLGPDDHTQLASEFETHADAVHRQVSQYADALAAGDQVLRERLREIERSIVWASI